MFRIFLFFLFIVSSFYGDDSTNYIEVKVGDEIITSYDIKEFVKKNSLTKEESVKFLVSYLIKKEAIKKSNINISPEIINNYIQQIIASSGARNDVFRANVLKQMSWNDYVSLIREKIKTEEFERRIIAKEMSKKSDDVFIDFYKKNQNKFKSYSSIKVITYSSTNQQDLLKVVKNPLAYVKSLTQTRQTLFKEKSLDNVYRFLAKMNLKTFSPIITKGNKFISYFVLEKVAHSTLQYDDIALEVKDLYAKKNKKNILDKYLKLLELNSNVIYVSKK